MLYFTEVAEDKLQCLAIIAGYCTHTEDEPLQQLPRPSFGYLSGVNLCLLGL